MISGILHPRRPGSMLGHTDGSFPLAVVRDYPEKTRLIAMVLLCDLSGQYIIA